MIGAGTLDRQIPVLDLPPTPGALGPSLHRLVALDGMLLYLQGLAYDCSSLLLAGSLSISSRCCY